MKWHWLNNNNIREKNRDIVRKILFFILSNKHQWYCKFIYILDNVIWFTHFKRWSKTDNQKNKSRQSIKHFRHFKQSIANRSCKTDLDINEFIQCIYNTQISFKAVQKDSNDSIMQIKKSDYTNLKTYWLIALLDIMKKALKSIIIKRLSNITETHHMLSDVQMRVRCKWFVILTLDLLVN